MVLIGRVIKQWHQTMEQRSEKEDSLKTQRVSVLSKTSCLFKIEISEKESTKTGRQGCQQVLASSEITEDARRLLSAGECIVRASGKVDGTCILFNKTAESKGEVILMMRQDLRISTSGKHAGKYVSKKGKPSPIPEGWISFLEKPNFQEAHGKWTHHIGFRPADPVQDKWGFDALLDDGTKARVLTTLYPEPSFKVVPLEELNGVTCELIGPKLQGNPHRVAEHCFVIHGDLIIDDISMDIDEIKVFLREDPVGQLYEGIVWHFFTRNSDVTEGKGKCFKVHRGHLGMEWN
jgi:hypothetical protein